jgi:hypothetical protein
MLNNQGLSDPRYNCKIQICEVELSNKWMKPKFGCSRALDMVSEIGIIHHLLQHVPPSDACTAPRERCQKFIMDGTHPSESFQSR